LRLRAETFEVLLNIRQGNTKDISAISQAYVESWRTTYEGLVPELFVKGMTVEAAVKIFTDSLQPNEYSYFLYVAETPEGRIVGFADGGKERSHPETGMGELYAIYLLKEFQGKGIGKAFFHEATKNLVQSGMNSMIVWVLEQSPYRKFYESMGGKLEPGIKRLDVVDQQIRLVPYRWENLKALL
jgi:GNAT superfamily N-acetyltransferase